MWKRALVPCGSVHSYHVEACTRTMWKRALVPYGSVHSYHVEVVLEELVEVLELALADDVEQVLAERVAILLQESCAAQHTTVTTLVNNQAHIMYVHSICFVINTAAKLDKQTPPAATTRERVPLLPYRRRLQNVHAWCGCLPFAS